jgi:hypothetical protein
MKRFLARLIISRMALGQTRAYANTQRLSLAEAAAE